MTLRRIAIAYDCLFPYTTGGGERQYRAFARDIAARGIEVDYLTSLQWDGPTPADEPFRVRAVSGRLRLYDAEGVRSSSAAARFAWHLFRALRRSRGTYDALIVSALPVLNVFAARAALWGTGTVVVADYLEVWGRRQWIQYTGRILGTVAWLLQRAAIALSPVATCHSRLSADRLTREGLRGTLLVSPGLIEGDTAPGTAGVVADPPTVVYAGRHIPDKRVESLPAAVAEARTRIPELQLVIAGRGPSSDLVREAVARAGGEEWIRMPGFVAQEELDRLMATAACVVNPSRREGYGLVVVESAAHGTPIVLVADEGNASTELIEPGRNGFIADDAGPASLGQAIARAVEGGAALRTRTRDWYLDAVTERSITRTIDAILTGIDEHRRERADRSGARKVDKT